MAATVTKSSGGRRPGYGSLLRTPGAWTFLLPGFAARQPFAMLTLSIVLLVEHTTGSYGTAGAVAAATGVSMALFAPQSGRLADRWGQAAVLVPGVLLHTAAVALLTALALLDAPLWALFAAAVPAGASVPQVGPMVRARWAALLSSDTGGPGASGTSGASDASDAAHDGPGGGRGGPSPLLATAAAFESVTDELTFVIGPVLATALCIGVHPAAGLVAEGTLTFLGGLLFAAQRRTQPSVQHAAGFSRGSAAAGHGAGEAGGSSGPAVRSGRRAERPASALSVPGVRVLAVLFLGIGSVFGGMQVSLTAFTEEIGHPGLNGALYGVFAGGNMLAGAVSGAVAWRRPPHRRLLIAYTALALATSPLWAVDSAVAVGALGLLVGLCIAPALVTGYTLVESIVPATARTEAFTWLTGAVALGQALAATASGRLADGFGAHAGFTVPLAGTGLALLVAVALRARLEPALPGRVVARGVDHRRAAAVD
ncbi:MFS transporter [Streptomyces sp. WAC 00631]|uniref:MFS transporter n=1 Tax=Streptomyces sp. WAC 00631 TaxID=2203201 RepID=UPI000F78FBE9|nr:MFS transporter [Streptomyces sp. WAC 00631]MCC5032939.1 MFS transporter [Streptomyces sp. WAC 00631]